MKIVMTGVTWSFTFVSELKNLFEFGAYDIEYELNEMSFCDDVSSSSIFCFGRATYSTLKILITDVIWNQRYFLVNPVWTTGLNIRTM